MSHGGVSTINPTSSWRSHNKERLAVRVNELVLYPPKPCINGLSVLRAFSPIPQTIIKGITRFHFWNREREREVWHRRTKENGESRGKYRELEIVWISEIVGRYWREFTRSNALRDTRNLIFCIETSVMEALVRDPKSRCQYSVSRSNVLFETS